MVDEIPTNKEERRKKYAKSGVGQLWGRWKNRNAREKTEALIKAVVATTMAGGMALGTVGYYRANDAQQTIRNNEAAWLQDLKGAQEAATLASQNAAAAQETAAQARENAASAQATATAAQQIAKDAETAAKDAATKADVAQSIADQAQVKAADAQNKAVEAQITAEQAKTEATAAQATAAQAIANLETVKNDLSSTQEDVETAQSAADKAVADAVAAQSAADKAAADAVTAQSVADSAKAAAVTAAADAAEARAAAETAQEAANEALAIAQQALANAATAQAAADAAQATADEAVSHLPKHFVFDDGGLWSTPPAGAQRALMDIAVEGGRPYHYQIDNKIAPASNAFCLRVKLFQVNPDNTETMVMYPTYQPVTATGFSGQEHWRNFYYTSPTDALIRVKVVNDCGNQAFVWNLFDWHAQITKL